MLRVIVGVGVFFVVAWIVDRFLLRIERLGWINYRRRGLSRPGAAYHALQLESVFNPAAEHVVEAKYADQEKGAESGEPPSRPE